MGASSNENIPDNKYDDNQKWADNIVTFAYVLDNIALGLNATYAGTTDIFSIASPPLYAPFVAVYQLYNLWC